MHSHPKIVVAVLALLAFAACADGGKEDRPQSEVKITAQHHMFGFRSLRGFGTFPVPTTAVFTDRGRLNLFDDSSYTITRTSGTTSPDRYAIESNGEFAVFSTGSGSEPTVVLLGGYGLINPGPEYCFTDRVSTNASPSVGLFYGTRLVQGQVELEGAWHVLSLHAVFDQVLLAPDNVARGAYCGVTVTTGAPGTLRTISGTLPPLTLGGSIQNVLDGGGNGDGTCNLTVTYQVGAQPVDSRVMQAVATTNVVLALDEDETDSEAGMLFMVRKFDAPASPADATQVDGRFLVGGHTFFVNPSNSGSDAFVGVVTLGAATGAQGAFRLDATGANGADFSYTGTYALAQDGKLTLTINGTNETWHAAIDKSYQTLIFVDDFVEVRANNIPELNLGFGVREKTS